MNLDRVDGERHGCVAREHDASGAWIDRLAQKNLLARSGRRQAAMSRAGADDSE